MVEADAQEILDWMHYWIWAEDANLPAATRDIMLANIAYFEDGGRFDGPSREKFARWVEEKEKTHTPMWTYPYTALNGD